MTRILRDRPRLVGSFLYRESLVFNKARVARQPPGPHPVGLEQAKGPVAPGRPFSRPARF